MAEQTLKRPQQLAESNAPKPKQRRRRSEEGLRRQREFDRKRQKSRIYIGCALERWRQVKEEKNLTTDADIACYLLDCYDHLSLDKGPAASPPAKGIQVLVKSERKDIFLSGHSDHDEVEVEVELEDVDVMEKRTDDVQDLEYPFTADEDSGDGSEEDSGDGSEDDYVPSVCMRNSASLTTEVDVESLPVTAPEDTVHGAPPDIFEPDGRDEMPFPEHLLVQCEDDIVGQSAFIVFETSLRQLVSTMQLPVTRCTWSDTRLGVQCDGVPLEVNIKKRGTGYVLEWNCTHGHLLWKWNSQPTFKYGMQAGDFLMATNILLSGNNYTQIALLFKFMNMQIVDESTFYRIQDEYCVDTIKSFCDEERRKVTESNPVALVDGKTDSPEHDEVRTLLAALDNIYHNNRPLRLNKKGKKIYGKTWNKKAQQWSRYSVKTKKDYAYIPHLQKAIVARRLQSGKGLSRRRPIRPHNPTMLGLLPPISPPPSQEHVQLQESSSTDGEDGEDRLLNEDC